MRQLMYYNTGSLATVWNAEVALIHSAYHGYVTVVCFDIYCKFFIIRKNFIFANIREFDCSQIQHSCKTFAHIEFT